MNEEILIPGERDNLKEILRKKEKANELLAESLEKRRGVEASITGLRREESGLTVSINELTKTKNALGGEVDKENDRLTKEREALEKLRLEEEEFIEERRQDTIKTLSGIEAKVDSETKMLSLIKDESGKLFSSIVSKVEQLFDLALLVVGKAERLISQAENLKKTAEETIAELRLRDKELEKKILGFSEADKALKTREEEVERKSKDAGERLKKARELVFWHKKPGVYKE